MSSKKPTTAASSEVTSSRERKSLATPRSANRSKESTSSGASERKVATPKSQLSKRLIAPFTATIPATPATKPTSLASNAATIRRSAQNPDRNSWNKPDKTLSNIVKAKHKKDNGLPVAWRKELYGPRPGSAQARLENLCATLHKEVEEQKKAKAASKVPPKRVEDRKSPPKAKAIKPPSVSQSRSTCVTSKANARSVPVAVAVKQTKAVPAATGVKQINIAPVATATEKFEDSCEMDVDDVEMGSPEPVTRFFPPTVQTNPDSMECDSFTEFKLPDQNANELVAAEAKHDTKKPAKEDTNEDSKQVATDLKTKYKDGLSAYSSYFYCIIDTNIFIENYKDFERFLSKKYVGRQPIVVVPYKVLHELDTVKHKKPELAPKITPVVRFLHQMLRAKDARVKGQHPWDDTIELMPVLSPDDSIINCALQVQSVAAGGDVQVVLVSNDCNMLTKALVANLNSCTMAELQTDYHF
ncbi:uncharacterized protein LOC118505497 [Anopheles stephensi]|uniref:PINc domain-containing protein n=1 Tax=Anopheles stephensi TaxID=30069 RepID=A0A182XVV7_ANOST|nr:uncharacterized protein LOC118505497 [Anopheles stephensi]